MKTVFFNTDILLQIAFADSIHPTQTDLCSAQLLSQVENGTVFGCTSTDVFSSLYKELSMIDAQSFLKKLSTLLYIFPVDEKIVQKALVANWNDYLCAIQYFTAVQAKADVIITNKSKSFVKSSISIQSPIEFLSTNRTNS